MNFWIWCFYTQLINHLTYIDQSTLSIIARSGITRSKTNNLIRFVIIPYAKTVFCIRACKTWNVLSSDLRNRNIRLFPFKAGLKSYYKHALSSTFDLDDPRTWKSVCVKCKRGSSLSQAISFYLVMSVCFLKFCNLVFYGIAVTGETCGEFPGSILL